MPRLLVEIDAAPVDLRRWAAVVPLLVDRFRALPFDQDGVVRLPGGRREGLRVIGGVPGEVGATYRLVQLEQVVDPATGMVVPDPATGQPQREPGQPVTLSLQRDNHRKLVCSLSAVVDASSGPTVGPSAATYEATATIEQPADPTRAHVRVSMPIPDAPIWLGRQIDLEGTIDVSDPRHPRLDARGRMRKATARATLEHRDGRLRADITVRPKGLLAFAGLAWPFVAGRARRSVAEGMTQWWTSVVTTLSPERSVEQLADEAMAELENDLVEHVPA